jgi:hypothetical protein
MWVIVANANFMQFNWAVECADMDAGDTAQLAVTVSSGAKTVSVFGHPTAGSTTFMGSLSG